MSQDTCRILCTFSFVDNVLVLDRSVIAPGAFLGNISVHPVHLSLIV